MQRRISINLICILVATGWACQAAQGQEERYREREVLDPNSPTWVAQPPEPEDEPLSRARALLVRDEPREARKLLEDWVEEHRNSDRYYEGVYLLGEAHFALGSYWKAAQQFETVSENTAGDLFFRAVERTMDVARAFLSGEKRIVWGFLPLPAQDEGIQLLDRCWQRVPGTRLGELALRIKADYFFEKGDMVSAQAEYALLAREYPNGRYVRLAMIRSAEAAEAMFNGLPYDDRPLLEATERYQQVAQAFPEFAEREDVAARLAGIRRARAAKDLSIAEWYERTNRVGAAVYYYRTIVQDWPDTPASDAAAERLASLGFTERPIEEE